MQCQLKVVLKNLEREKKELLLKSLMLIHRKLLPRLCAADLLRLRGSDVSEWKCRGVLVVSRWFSNATIVCTHCQHRPGAVQEKCCLVLFFLYVAVSHLRARRTHPKTPKKKTDLWTTLPFIFITLNIKIFSISFSFWLFRGRVVHLVLGRAEYFHLLDHFLWSAVAGDQWSKWLRKRWTEIDKCSSEKLNYDLVNDIVPERKFNCKFIGKLNRLEKEENIFLSSKERKSSQKPSWIRLELF